jgi:hypothetical protein
MRAEKGPAFKKNLGRSSVANQFTEQEFIKALSHSLSIFYMLTRPQEYHID